MAGKGTPATVLLSRNKVRHQVHEYAHDPRSASYGTEASELLGLPAERVFKTLVAEVDGVLTSPPPRIFKCWLRPGAGAGTEVVGG